MSTGNTATGWKKKKTGGLVPTTVGVPTQSGATSGDLSIPDWKNETPIVPYTPGQVGTPAPTAHAVAVAAAAEQEHNAEQAAAKAARHLARTRQKQLVSTYVTKAYSNKLKKQGTPQAEIGRRIKSASDQLAQDRKRLLSHPAVKSANAEGKVVGFKGLQKVKRAEAPKPSSTRDLFAKPTKASTLHVEPGKPQAAPLPHTRGHGAMDFYKQRAVKEDSPFNDAIAGYVKGEAQNAVNVASAKLGDPLDTAKDLAQTYIPAIAAVRAISGDNPAPTADELRLYANFPAAKTAGTLGKGATKVVPGILEGGAKWAGRAEKGGTAIKNLPQALRGLPQVLKATPDALRAARKAAPGAAKGAAKKAPAAAGRATKRGGEATYQSVGGLGILGAASKGTGTNIPGGNIPEGQYRALANDPLGVASATASQFPGLLISAGQLPVAGGKSLIEGSPAPLEGALDAQVEFAKKFYETYGEGTPGQIQKATEDEGLVPEMLLYPFGRKLTGKGGKALSGKLDLAAKLEARRLPDMDEKGVVLTHDHGGPVRKGTRKNKIARENENKNHRREEARHGANTRNLVELDAASRSHAVDKHAYKAAGDERVIREGLTPERHGLNPRQHTTLKARKPDFIPFLLNAHIDLAKPEAALAQLKHYAEIYKEHDPVKDGINPDKLMAQDAVNYFLKHPEELRDPELMRTLDRAREVSKGTGEFEGLHSLSTSLRNEHLGPAVAHGRTLPEQMTPPEALPLLPKGTTKREDAWKYHDEQRKLAEETRKDAQAAWTQATGKAGHRVELKDRAKLERKIERSGTKAQKAKLAEAKRLYAKAAELDAKQVELFAALDPYTRPGANPDLNSERTAYTEQMEQQFARDMNAFYEEQGLHPEGIYVPDTAPIDTATGAKSAIGGDNPVPGGPKINTGEMFRKGYSQQGYEHFKNEGLLRPVHLQRSFEDARRMDADHGVVYEGHRVGNGKWWGKLLRNGIVHKEDHVFVPDQQMKRLMRDVSGGEHTDHQKTLLDVQKDIVKDTNRLADGTMYRAYPKAVWEEFVKQAQDSPIPKWLRKSNQMTSLAMLATPSFVGAQVIAEGVQGLASVNPVRAAQGLSAYKKLNWEQKLQLSSVAGEASGMLLDPGKFHEALHGGPGSKQFTDSMNFWRRTLLGRGVIKTVKGELPGVLDRLKGSRIRRATLTGEILRDVNGMQSKTRKLLNKHSELDKAMRGKTYAEQLAYIADHPKILDEYQKQFHDMMGGWNNLTRSGHIPESYRAAALLFYPFVRMSILWPFKYAKHHPLKATALVYLNAENNWAIKEALEGEPAFMNFAQIPTWKEGENGEPVSDKPLQAQRFAIGGNLFVQLTQGTGDLTDGFQPLLQALGKGVFGGGDLVDRVKAVAGETANVSPYVRAYNTAKGQAASGQSKFGVLGNRANLSLDALAALQTKLKGPIGSQLLGSLGLPGYKGNSLDNQRDEALLGRIFDKLSATSDDKKRNATVGTAKEQREVRAYNEKLDNENKEATDELAALYKKHGLSKVYERGIEVFKFTHPLKTEKEEKEEDKGGWSNDGWETKGWEGSGWGNEKDKPVPVPREDNGLGLPGLGGPLGAIASPLAALVGGTPAQAATRSRLSGKTGPTGEGQGVRALAKQTVGTPTKKELIEAGRARKLAINREGKITTPAVRKASKELRRAETKATPKIEGIENSDQREFAQYLSKYSGLPPKLVGEWVKQEGGGWGSDGVSGGQAGEQNWLGVGYPGEQTAMSRSAYFNKTTPQKAAKATAEWIEGKIGHEYNYRAAPSIQVISQMAKEGAPEAAIKSYIEGPSAWGTGEINQSGVTVSGGGKAATQALKVAKRNARAVGLNPTPFNGDIERGSGKTVTVRADAKGMVNWAKSAEGTPEGTPKQQRWASKYGLGFSEPWCANFVSNGLARRGITDLPSNPNYVPSYESEWANRNVGTDLAKAKPGDLLTFSGEHIGIYVGNGEMISGNSSDAVTRTPVDYGGPPLSAILRPGYKGGKIKIHESAVLPGATPEAALGGAIPSTGTASSAPTSVPTKGEEKKKQKKQSTPVLSGAQKLKLVNEITEGNLEGLGIPGYQPTAGPAVADLAALGKSLEAQRRKLARL